MLPFLTKELAAFLQFEANHFYGALIPPVRFKSPIFFLGPSIKYMALLQKYQYLGVNSPLLIV